MRVQYRPSSFKDGYLVKGVSPAAISHAKFSLFWFARLIMPSVLLLRFRNLQEIIICEISNFDFFQPDGHFNTHPSLSRFDFAK